MEEAEDISSEEIDKRDKFDKEEVEDVEGRITDFFLGLFGRKKEKEPAVDEDDDNSNIVDEEDDFIEEESWDGNPFVKDSKLYGQDLDKLKSKYLAAGQLFRDKRFPPNSSSLFYSSPAPNIEWKRPHELCDDPRMIVDGIDRFDINQGELGDCWLLAAMSSLAMDKKMLCKVLPKDQSFEENYIGMFKFRFWQYGEWVDVVVDDFLPCINGKLVYMRSDSKNEFWSPLFEKAYAKLHGSYQALKGGSTCEAMVDFTGGCSEIFDLTRTVPADLFTIMQSYFLPGKEKVKQEDMQWIFKISCREIHVKMNLQGLYDSFECEICKKEIETQEHVYKCKEIWKLSKYDEENISEYEEIMNGNTEKQVEVARILKEHIKIIDR